MLNDIQILKPKEMEEKNKSTLLTAKAGAVW